MNQVNRYRFAENSSNYDDATSNWRHILSNGITEPDELRKYIPVNIEEIYKVTRQYPMFINPYFLSLITGKHDPLGKQAIPDIREISESDYGEDPLFEESQSPVPGLIHRYRDNVLMLVSNRCAVHCRYCMRKRIFRGFDTVNVRQ